MRPIFVQLAISTLFETEGQRGIECIYHINNYMYIYITIPIGSMYGIYANIGGIMMVNVTIYSIHGSYGIYYKLFFG